MGDVALTTVALAGKPPDDDNSSATAVGGNHPPKFYCPSRSHSPVERERTGMPAMTAASVTGS
jgi:hypothetical protein